MRNTLLLVILLSFMSCKKSNVESDYEVLNVDLTETSVPLKELFSRVEVVPLETTDSSLIIRPQKVLVHDNQFFVFDEGTPAVFVFDAEGHIIHKIGKKGQGPGEYREIYDALVNGKEQVVHLLSPFGSIYSYTLDGHFIEQTNLPMKSNYQTMEELGDHSFVTWTLPSAIEEPGVSLVLKDSMKETKGYWYESRILNFQNPRVFYKYDDKVYFSTPFHHEVYEVTADSLRISYKWDFGKENIDLKQYGFSFTSDKEREEDALITKYLLDSTIPYILSKQYQNDKFYYSKLTFGFRVWKNLFYRKADGRSFFFEKTAEGIALKPLAFTDDYLICLVPNEEFKNYKKVLDADEYTKLENRTEDDNPCLIKFYFQ